MEQYKLLYDQLGKGLEAVQEAERLRGKVNELDTTIKSQADTIRLSQEEQKALQQEIEQLNNTIKLLKEQLEKPVPVPPVVPKPEPPVVKESREPIILERAGNYKNGVIHAPNGSALVLKTGDKSVFENFDFNFAKHGVENHGGLPTNIELINCRFNGLPFKGSGDAMRSISANHVKNLIVKNCESNLVGFITTQHDFTGDRRVDKGLVVSDVVCKNISGKAGSNYRKANFVQIMNVYNGMPVDIGHSIVENEEGENKSHTEDLVNIFNARGFADQPIYIHDLLLIGAFYAPSQRFNAKENKNWYTGGGIIADGDGDYSKATAYVLVENNTALALGNYCYGIAAGHHITFRNNIAVVAAVLPNGTKYSDIMHNTSGIWAYPQSYTLGKMDNNIFVNTIVGVNYYNRRNDISAMTGAVHKGTDFLDDPITPETEQKFKAAYLEKHKNRRFGVIS